MRVLERFSAWAGVITRRQVGVGLLVSVATGFLPN